MNLRGDWYLFANGNHVGSGLDVAKLPVMHIADGKVTFADGTEPTITRRHAKEKRRTYATVTLDCVEPDGRHVRILIDRASDKSMGGVRYVAKKSLPETLKDGALPRGVTVSPIHFWRVEEVARVMGECTILPDGTWIHGTVDDDWEPGVERASVR